MRPPTRRELTVALAVLLVAVPVWAPVLDVTGPDYRYETVELSTQDGKLAVDAPDGSHVHDVAGIDCFDRSVEFTRQCFYDGGAIDGNVTGVNPSIVEVSGPAAAGELTRTRDDEYVMLGDEVYRRSTTFVEANESAGLTVELGVDRLDPVTALEDVADEDAAAPARTAIEVGSVTTNEPIEDTNEVLAVDGSYYVVFEESRQRSYPENPGTERLFEAVSVAAGAWLLLRS